jgi:hypothetical protein
MAQLPEDEDIHQTETAAFLPSDRALAETPLNEPWNIFMHESADKQWDRSTHIATLTTVADFWCFVNNVNVVDLDRFFFYLVRNGYEPHWENPQYDNGGIYSVSVSSYHDAGLLDEIICPTVTDNFPDAQRIKCVVMNKKNNPHDPNRSFTMVKTWYLDRNCSDNSVYQRASILDLPDSVFVKFPMIKKLDRPIDEVRGYVK